ncbi:hypothetical protein [Novosphingobium sp. EMRT-2]|uniref:hypothetical protein n=1 Tax=Novosphingobium sp. EMRT-2 TaxID=2571749 RepID=UPI0010BD941F|nr:hypothetical protein [Novosphingobium sp. EMRT-2]QCI93084.1 hypothetical protein FA702_05635 [Novosphingobium sp. EMRT-2]
MRNGIRRLAVLVSAGLLLAGAAPLQATTWYRARTAHFVMYSDGDPKALRTLAQKAQKFEAVLNDRYKAVFDPDTPPIDIYILRSQENVAKLMGGSKTTAGFYKPDTEGSIILSNREGASNELDLDRDSTLFHEYTHYFMLHNFVSAYPAWFTEGFAELLATVEFPAKGGYEIGRPPKYRAYGLFMSTPVPITSILGESSFSGNAEQLDFRYGRSWLLTHMLVVGTKRKGQMDTYLNLLNTGTALPEAAQQAFGDLAQLDKDLDKYRSGRLTYYRFDMPASDAPEPAIEQLDAVETQLIPYRLMRRAGDDAASAVEPLALIAQANPASAAAWFEFARAASVAADEASDSGAKAALRQRAADALDRVLSLDPAHVRALLYKAEAQAEHLHFIGNNDPARWKEVGTLLRRANAGNPNDPLVLYQWYRNFGLRREAPPQNARDALARAFQLAPDVTDIRVAYGFDLARHDDFTNALAVVRPIAFDPHNAQAGISVLLSLREMQKRRDQEKKDGKASVNAAH